jgi:hypothetical protein
MYALHVTRVYPYLLFGYEAGFLEEGVEQPQ